MQVCMLQIDWQWDVLITYMLSLKFWEKKKLFCIIPCWWKIYQFILHLWHSAIARSICLKDALHAHVLACFQVIHDAYGFHIIWMCAPKYRQKISDIQSLMNQNKCRLGKTLRDRWSNVLVWVSAVCTSVTVFN